MVSLCVGRLFLLLNEAQDIELRTCRFGKKLLIASCSSPKISNTVVNFVRIRTRDSCADKIQDFKRAAGLLQSSKADDQASEAGRIDIIHLVEIQNHIDLPVIGEFADFFTKAGNGLADGQSAIEIEDDDPFAFALLNIEGHMGWSAVALF